MSGTVKVTKMSGAGNDFVVLDAAARAALAGDWEGWVRRVCRRGLSVGADGVLVVTPVAPDRVKVEFWNPDGGTAFCGNGSRCAARYARLRGFAGESMTLETAAGEVPARICGDRVRIEIGPPRDLGSLELDLDDARIRGRRIDSGAPHFVERVADVAAYPLDVIGPRVRRHPVFGERGTNFDVIATPASAGWTLRTWERGVEAETLACGSGAVAAAYAVRLAGGPETCTLVTAGGVALDVELPGPPDRPRGAALIGDARVIFEATLSAESTSGF